MEPCDNWSDVILRVKNKQGIGILSNITAYLAMQCGLKGCSLTGMDVSSSLIATWNQKENNPLLVDLAHILKCSISSA